MAKSALTPTTAHPAWDVTYTKVEASRQLPHYTDFWCDGRGALLCDILDLTPRLEMYWRYTAEQDRSGEKWECSTVWLHNRPCPDENTDVYEDLIDCINQLAQHKSSDKVRYSLLVNQQGMCLPACSPCPPPRPGTPRTRRAMPSTPFACPRHARATWPPRKASFPRSGSPRPWK